jgi:mxaK protein
MHKTPWLLIIIVVLSLLASIYTGIKLWQAAKINQLIININDYDGVPKHSMVQFAQAFNYSQQGKLKQALMLLTQVLSTDDIKLKASAYYNRGNINLRHALLLDDGDPERASLVEFAKQDYRSALLLESDQWNARFNLELALKLIPEKPETAEVHKDEGGKFAVKSFGFKVELP